MGKPPLRDKVSFIEGVLFICVCVCLRPSTVKASSVGISWDTREQINDVVLKALDSLPVPFIALLECRN